MAPGPFCLVRAQVKCYLWRKMAHQCLLFSIIFLWLGFFLHLINIRHYFINFNFCLFFHTRM
jgi:hypothetical protein